MRIFVSDCRRVVGEHYKIPREAMLGPSHAYRVARPRQMAMALAREFTGESLPKIGHLFGGRDHTTVLFAIRNVQKREAESDSIRDVMAHFRLILTTKKEAQREATEL